MAAPKFKLDNLCVLLDYNKIQLSGAVKTIMNLEPLMDKWRAFNWNIMEIDGHDFKAIMQESDPPDIREDRFPASIFLPRYFFTKCATGPKTQNGPTVIVAFSPRATVSRPFMQSWPRRDISPGKNFYPSES